MAKESRPIYVVCERWDISAGVTCDLTVYRVDDQFYTSWNCPVCRARGKTRTLPDVATVLAEAKKAIQMHFGRFHRGA